MTITQERRDLWSDVGELTRWLDGHNGRNPQETTLRIMKIGEEFGEVVTAYIGATGQNPRKGVCATHAQVLAELCDVIVTAAVAMTTYTGDAMVARALLADHMRTLVSRTRGADGPSCPACGGTRTAWQAFPSPGVTDRGDAWSCECGHQFTITLEGFAAAGEGRATS